MLQVDRVAAGLGEGDNAIEKAWINRTEGKRVRQNGGDCRKFGGASGGGGTFASVL